MYLYTSFYANFLLEEISSIFFFFMDFKRFHRHWCIVVRINVDFLAFSDPLSIQLLIKSPTISVDSLLIRWQHARSWTPPKLKTRYELIIRVRDSHFRELALAHWYYIRLQRWWIINETYRFFPLQEMRAASLILCLGILLATIQNGKSFQDFPNKNTIIREKVVRFNIYIF